MANPVTIRALRILADQYHRVHRRLNDGYCQRCSAPWPCDEATAADELERLAQVMSEGIDVHRLSRPIDAIILEQMRRISEAIPEPHYGPHACGKIGG